MAELKGVREARDSVRHFTITVTNEMTSSGISSPHPDPLPEGEGSFWIRHRNYDLNFARDSGFFAVS